MLLLFCPGCKFYDINKDGWVDFSICNDNEKVVCLRINPANFGTINPGLICLFPIKQMKQVITGFYGAISIRMGMGIYIFQNVVQALQTPLTQDESICFISTKMAFF